MKHPKRILALIAPFALFVLFLLTTDPYKLPLVLIIIPFLLLGAGLYRLSIFACRKIGISTTKSRVVASIITALILLLALLQSIHQLSIKDFLILAALLVGLTLYL